MKRPALVTFSLRILLVLLLAFLLAVLTGCATSTSSTTTSAIRNYNGTASVGDFLTLTINSTASTIDYTNHTNGDTGTVPYTMNHDGTYTVTDPQGNLLEAFEVPGFVLVVESAKSGPTHNTTAIITAIESVPTARVTAGNGDRQDFFIRFQGKAAVFGSFQTAVPLPQQTPTYTYFYGVGLK